MQMNNSGIATKKELARHAFSIESFSYDSIFDQTNSKTNTYTHKHTHTHTHIHKQKHTYTNKHMHTHTHTHTLTDKRRDRETVIATLKREMTQH